MPITDLHDRRGHERRIDPTHNVERLVAASERRQDDLREKDNTHLKEMADIRDEYQKELRTQEAKRINDMRLVDVEAGKEARIEARETAKTLAAQVTGLATTVDASLTTRLDPIITSIATLTRNLYEQQGQKAAIVEQKVETHERRSDGQLTVGNVLAGLAFLVSIGLLITMIVRG
jgi:hypothetical protein